MVYMLKFFSIAIVVVLGNYLVISYLPTVPDIAGDKLVSIFPPMWESSVNTNDISFGWKTSLFLVFLFFFAINLKKIETKNPLKNHFFILLLSMGFIIDGTFLMSMLFVTLYVMYVLWECCDENYEYDDLCLIIPVAFFAIILLSFSAFVIRYRGASPDLVGESLIFLVILFVIRLIRQYYSNNKEKIISTVN